MRLLLITNRYPVDADDPASPFVPHFVNALISCGVQADFLTPSYASELGHGQGWLQGNIERMPGQECPGHPTQISQWGGHSCPLTGTAAEQPFQDSLLTRPIDGDPEQIRRGGSQTRPNDSDHGVRVFRFRTGTTAPVGSWNLLNPLSWIRLARFMRNGRTMGKRLCAGNTYHHILALWALPSGHFAQTLSRRFHVPYSVWCLGSDIYTWARRPLIRGRIAGILTGASHVFADGEDLCRRIRSWLEIDAIFLPSFRPLEGLEGLEPPPPTESPRFLYLGRLHRDKGIFELLMAFAHVRMALLHATLRYVGDGPEKRKLETLAAEMHLLRPDDLEANSVLVGGAVSHEGVVRALHECDWVVIPTRSDSIPLVFTEAVQAMRPVIGTDAGDLGTLIRRFGLGHVSPSAESRDLASTMIRAVHDPVFDLRGRAKLLQLFDPRRSAQSFCDRVFPSLHRPPESPPVNTIAQMSHV